MWTAEARTLVGDFGAGQALSDEQYALLVPLIPPAKPGGRPRTTDMRRMLDGLFYLVRTGCQWRHLPPPPAFPPWRTIYGYMRAFADAGVWEGIRHHLVVMLRERDGREPSPSAAIVDTQAVRCIAVRGPRGYDAAKGVVGRKRVALVDAEGHWLAVAVVPASVQDRDTLEALDAGKARWPTLREGIYDGAFAAERCREWSNVHGMRHRVVTRDPAARGFVVLARRWVVERSFGWLSHWGGLARDRAGRLDVSAARLALVGVLSGFEALLDPMPVRAPAQ